MNLKKSGKRGLRPVFASLLCFVVLLCITPFCLAFILPQHVNLNQHNSTVLPFLDSLKQENIPLVENPAENLIGYAIKQLQSDKKIITTDEHAGFGFTTHRQVVSQNAIFDFYENITGKSDVTRAILTYADKYDIPLTLAFSLAYNESRYKVTAVNGNTNTSIDRGLFQLNSNSFPSLTEEDFFDPYTSAKQGLAFLRYCLDIGGNEITALAMYNAGPNRVRTGGTPQMTLHHISNIITYQKKLEKLFYTEVIETLKTDRRDFFMLASNLTIQSHNLQNLNQEVQKNSQN